MKIHIIAAVVLSTFILFHEIGQAAYKLLLLQQTQKSLIGCRYVGERVHSHYLTITDKKTKALAHVVRENAVITECYLFGDSSAIMDFLAQADEEGIRPTRLTTQEFSKLRQKCAFAQAMIPTMIKEQDSQLKSLAQEVKVLEKSFDTKLLTDKNDKANLTLNNLLMPDGRRRKRSASIGWEILRGIYPGTLWCGMGNLADAVADSPDGLGEKKEVDKCCRAHDHCHTTVCAWCQFISFINNLWNWSPWTKCHCDCDEQFKNCLRGVPDDRDDAAMVGQLFFDIIDIDCIHLDYPVVCVEEGWLWGCNRYARDYSADLVYEWHDQDGY